MLNVYGFLYQKGRGAGSNGYLSRIRMKMILFFEETKRAGGKPLSPLTDR